MKPIYQTKFRGSDSPVGERGNCFQAAVASLLELPLEEAPDIQEYDEEMKWFDIFREWLNKRGLTAFGLSTEGNILLQGYHLIETKSTTLQNGELHVCVGYNQKIIHDPNPNATSVGEIADYIVVMPLNPAFSPEVKE